MPKKGYMFGRKKQHNRLRGRHAKKVLESASASVGLEEDAPAESMISQELNTSAAKRKSELSSSSINLQRPPDSGLQYSIVSSFFLSSLASSLSCPECLQKSLVLQTTKTAGLAEFFILECTLCESKIWSQWTSPPMQDSKRQMDINFMSVLALKECGITHSKFSNFCGLVSLPKYVHRNTFARISKSVHAAAMRASEDCMKKAADVVNDRAMALPDARKSSMGCPVITVSFDGTWHKHGHSSHTGVGTVIEFYTGLILDSQVISNFCKGCLSAPDITCVMI